GSTGILSAEGRGNNRRRGNQDLQLQGAIKSTDGGQTWASINDGLPPANRATTEQQLFVNPQTPMTIYTNSDKGFFKSEVGGGHWLTTGLQGTIRALAVNPADGGILYVASQSWGDAFVAKLNDAGTALIYSTYLGGLRVDLANG